MRILMINSVCGIRSTGRICTDLALEYERQGHKVKIAYGRESVPEQYQKYAIKIGTVNAVRINALKARLLDNEGFNAKNATRKFLEWADEYNPDLLWLHNLHGYYINLELLFNWIKSRPGMEVKWLLHDCWAFTGHCSHFTLVKCEQWKTHCSYCIQKGAYPSSWIRDNCKKNFDRKKKLFCGVRNMTLITPSQWLSDLVNQSFLKDYLVVVRHNTINTKVFKPTPSDFRQRYNLEKKKIILGVASQWNKEKGLNDFVKLSKILDDSYAVVLVGLTEKQIKNLPDSIIGIQRTNSEKELAAVYTAADLFLNLTYQDNYPTVNLEAQACGTSCITYRTGGSVESVPSENVVEQGDLEAIVNLIRKYTMQEDGNEWMEN